MSKWSNFLKAQFAGPVIRVDNEEQLKELQRLALTNKLEGYKQFCSLTYDYIIHLLELNYRESDFNAATNNRKSFLVEYSYRGGFVCTYLTEYDRYRHSPDEWEVVPMTTILNELK